MKIHNENYPLSNITEHCRFLLVVPLLSQAMSDVVEARPIDPIAHLASFLKARAQESRQALEAKEEKEKEKEEEKKEKEEEKDEKKEEEKKEKEEEKEEEGEEKEASTASELRSANPLTYVNPFAF